MIKRLNNIIPNTFQETTPFQDLDDLSASDLIVDTALARGTTDSLSNLGNRVRAEVIGVITGKPMREYFPHAYLAGLRSGSPEQLQDKDYYLFIINNELNGYMTHPEKYCTSIEQFVQLAKMFPTAISSAPAEDCNFTVGAGDIVDVYVQNKNTFEGATVVGVAKRNNFSSFVPPPANSFVGNFFATALEGSFGDAVFGTSGFAGVPLGGTNLGVRPPNLPAIGGSGVIMTSDVATSRRIPILGGTPITYRVGDDGTPMDFDLFHSRRDPQNVSFITLHNAGFLTAERLGSYFREANDYYRAGDTERGRQVSVHLGVSEEGVQQYLPITDINAWHAGVQNSKSIGIDIVQPYVEDSRYVGENPTLYRVVDNPAHRYSRGPQRVVALTPNNLNHITNVIVSILSGLGKPLSFATGADVVNGRGAYSVDQIIEAGWTVVPHAATAAASSRWDVCQWWDQITAELTRKWRLL